MNARTVRGGSRRRPGGHPYRDPKDDGERSRRLRRVVLLVALLGVLVALVVTQREELFPGRAPGSASGPGGRPRPTLSAGSRLRGIPASTSALAALLDDRLRAPPDARLLLAFDALEGPGEHATTARYERDRWTLERGGEALGTLPERPTLRDALTVLVQRARSAPTLRRGDAPPELVAAADAALDGARGSPLEALAALQSARSCEGVSTGCWTLAGRLLTALTVEMPDRLGAGGMVPARALAVLARLRAAGAALPREECLLAAALGYLADAEALASGLPEDDPVRAFALRDDARLATLAPGRRQATLLLAIRARTRGDPVGVAAALAALGPTTEDEVPRLDLGGEALQAFAARGEWFPTIPARMVHALERALGSASGAPVGAGQEFDRLAAWVSRAPPSGPWWARDVASAYGYAVLYSAIGDNLVFLLDGLGSPRAARGYLASLGAHPSATTFFRWASHLVAAALHEPVHDELLEDLGGLPGLGPSALDRTSDALQERTSFGDPRRLDGLYRYAHATDSRPHGLSMLGFAVLMYGADLKRSEALFSAAERRAPGAFPHARLTLQALRGDVEGLEAAARDRGLSLSARRYAVAVLSGQSADADARRERALRALIVDAPADGAAALALARLLIAQRRYDEVGPALARWTSLPPAEVTVEAAQVRALAAQALRRAGRPVDAWGVAGPALQTGQHAALLECARTLVALQDLVHAEELAVASAERYGADEDGALLASVRWRRGDLAGAVAALRSVSPSRLGWLEDVGPAFAEVFSAPERQDAAVAAFVALTQGTFEPEDLVSFLDGVGNRGPPALALALREREPASGGLVEGLDRQVEQFRLRRTLFGANAAEDWLRNNVGPTRRAPLSRSLFIVGEHALLWSHTEAPRDRGGDGVWMFRAAASLRTPPSPAEAASLAAQLDAPGYSMYHTVMQHLLGRDVLARLREEAVEPTAAGEAAYWIGYRAQVEGRYAEASDWYQYALLVGSPRKTEWRLALYELSAWAAREHSLERLQAERFWRLPPVREPEHTLPGR
ncbi:MAG: hypothetical protein HY909_08740 [Deltaproteobacteria bacterium]|nr:hypothetical protein [Deltaproteobacteria bacterium]